MPADAVAPMPQRRLARGLTGLRARRHRERLDRALADGRDPWAGGELMARAAQLTALPMRRKLALAIADLIVIAHYPGPVARTVTAADVHRQPIREERDRLAELAHRIHGPAPVPVQCVALLATLLWHDADALCDPAQAASLLADALDRCCDVLEPATPDRCLTPRQE